MIEAGRTGQAEDNGAGGGWVAADTAAVGAVQRVVLVFGVEGSAGDAAQFTQGGNGWRGLALDFCEDALEGRRDWVRGDGEVEVIGEAAEATIENIEVSKGVGLFDGTEPIAAYGVGGLEGVDV
ncbi:MAG: hypothetical protein F4X64_03505 [Chloroflexi bacterium]|nr:hypothetical protein [Chloroflexota bacterium]